MKRPHVTGLYVACVAASLVVTVWVLWVGIAGIVRGDFRAALGILAFLPLCIGLMTAAYEHLTDRGNSRTFVHLALLLPVCCLLSFLSHIV